MGKKGDTVACAWSVDDGTSKIGSGKTVKEDSWKDSKGGDCKKVHKVCQKLWLVRASNEGEQNWKWTTQVANSDVRQF